MACIPIQTKTISQIRRLEVKESRLLHLRVVRGGECTKNILKEVIYFSSESGTDEYSSHSVALNP